MSNSGDYLPFSQREGFADIPEQLKIGEISDEMRRLIDYYIGEEISSNSFHDGEYTERWTRVAKDFHVLFLKKSARTFSLSSHKLRRFVDESTERMDIAYLFDLVEFFIRHPDCSVKMKGEIAHAFVHSRAAYRIIDGQVVAIGNDQQAKSVVSALEATKEIGALASRAHLVRAGKDLERGDWSSSVRESIHAVEAIAKLLSVDASSLGPALSKLEKDGYLHGGLKRAFGALYGYTSDEEGIRHAVVFEEQAKVDEVDALFMLGACASFVEYLASRSVSISPGK